MLRNYLTLGIASVFLAAQPSLSCSLMEIDKTVMKELYARSCSSGAINR